MRHTSLYLVAEALVAGSAVEELVRSPFFLVDDGEARGVQVLPATPFARVCFCVTHA